MDLDIYQQLIEQNKARSNDGVIARFYDRAVKTGIIDANGIPKFATVCYCEIRIKDNTTEVFDQPATQDKIERFPVEYARYQLAKKQAQTGAALEKFAFLTPAEIESCKYHGIFTLEALAELDETKARTLNLTGEQQLARRFLQNNRQFKQTADIDRLKQSYEDKIASLQAQISFLQQSRHGRKKK
ncbi:MAG: hypothetical protein IJ529_00150 [Alphaproteobacteria bacterium]|nr:hypothetical protein [Alphaproteobacteria bacterium]MBQ9235118.1 hypothetical protein [Alphaproteobacteria bacterium]